eukprot:scaffold51766_cov53-Attheya_sp.AAC.2
MEGRRLEGSDVGGGQFAVGLVGIGHKELSECVPRLYQLDLSLGRFHGSHVGPRLLLLRQLGHLANLVQPTFLRALRIFGRNGGRVHKTGSYRGTGHHGISTDRPRVTRLHRRARHHAPRGRLLGVVLKVIIPVRVLHRACLPLSVPLTAPLFTD